jgi:tetratricopeptide (TPR) repeat protein
MTLESRENNAWRLKTAELIEALEEGGRANEVEPLLIEWMAKRQGNSSSGNDAPQHLLSFYVRHNRMADAVILLTDAPWWGEKRDALALLDDRCGEDGRLDKPIANALFETGRVDEAKKLLTEVMKRSHSRDWTYELLLKMAGDKLDDFLVLMDTLYARDAFEERPLIWKAEALRRLKRLEDAEKVIRHALKVDPTDGESPAGERVRAYGVLADILADRGKEEDAKFFRDVVEAVRVAEKGDELATLGLVQRSLEYFAKAETLFADAYCVQWRLAERMRAMGKLEEAQKHYEIAFERMPEQFGQVASLCFGCMGVFDSEESCNAAENVLSRLVKTSPVRPAVYYLMGQLREKQKRYEEAYEAYTKALEGDPDYLDVMRHLYGLRKNIKRPDADWAAIQTRMIKLDPLGKHFTVSGNDILDWASFWTIRNGAVATLPPSLETLFPLTANVKRLDAEKEKKESRSYRSYSSYSYSSRAGAEASQVLMQSSLVSRLRSLDGEFARKKTAGNAVVVEEEDDDDDDDDDDE